MKNKRVKQMMASVFNGYWKNYNSNGRRFYGNGMRLMVFEGYLGEHVCHGDLYSLVSLTADQLKAIK